MRAPAPLLVLTLIAAGCATAPVVEEGGWAAHRARLAALENWSAQGRLSVSAPGESYQGRFTWEQQSDWLEARFRGPLGVGGVFIYGRADALTALARNGETVRLSDPERDLARLFGHPVPVLSMRRWLLGLADPEFDHEYRFDDTGLPRRLEQRAWRIAYTDWREFDGRLLPRRIDMQGEEVSIRVVLDDWQPEAASR